MPNSTDEPKPSSPLCSLAQQGVADDAVILHVAQRIGHTGLVIQLRDIGQHHLCPLDQAFFFFFHQLVLIGVSLLHLLHAEQDVLFLNRNRNGYGTRQNGLLLVIDVYHIKILAVPKGFAKCCDNGKKRGRVVIDRKGGVIIGQMRQCRQRKP